MRRPPSTVPWLALLSLAFAGGACKQTDTILLIEVAGPQMLGATHLSVTVSPGADPPKNFTVPTPPLPPGTTIPLPASFAMLLDRSHMGPITVSIDAKDDTNSNVATGTTTMQHINIGGETIIAVMLGDLPPDQQDGGADSGQAGGGGKAGTGGGGSGGGGSGGLAGQGGASGREAGTDGDGATGLDGATD